MAFGEPVLIIAFNRPDRVDALIDRLREIQPSKVYLAVDGPRTSVDADAEKVERVKQAARGIDWPCEVRTNFQLSNLGCGVGVSTAIGWFFANEERGIVLEDDVMPTLDFFPYCAELLERYQDDRRVFSISGCNFVPPGELTDPAASYRFSAITHVWGWAAWRRSWDAYEYDMANWRKRLPLKQRWRAMGGNLGGFVYWTAVYDWMRFGHLDTWDYQFSLAQMAEGTLTATSNVNLVDNVGFDADATHTTSADKPAFIRPSEPITFPLTHPATVSRDLKADRWVRSQVLTASTQSAWRMFRTNVLQRVAGAKHGLVGR